MHKKKRPAKKGEEKGDPFFPTPTKKQTCWRTKKGKRAVQGIGQSSKKIHVEGFQQGEGEKIH